MNNKTKYLLSCISLLCAGLLLSGCSKKPPGCADPQTMQTVKSLVESNAKEGVPPVFKEAVADDPQNLVGTYWQGLKVEVSQIVSDGYNADAKKFACRGDMKVVSAAETTISEPIQFTTQLALDKPDTFIVEVAGIRRFTESLALDMLKTFNDKRYGGTWSGDYVCDGLGGATEGPQGPFKMPVGMVFAGGRLKLERTTRGGGVEILEGNLNKEIILKGGGRNTPDDTWQARFSGKITGMDFYAVGEILTPEGTHLRNCAIKLTLPTNK